MNLEHDFPITECRHCADFVYWDPNYGGFWAHVMGLTQCNDPRPVIDPLDDVEVKHCIVCDYPVQKPGPERCGVCRASIYLASQAENAREERNGR